MPITSFPEKGVKIGAFLIYHKLFTRGLNGLCWDACRTVDMFLNVSL